MSNKAATPETVPTRQPKSSTSRKLIQAAALAAVLVPLGSVAVEAATINCLTSFADGSGCGGQTGSYNNNGFEQSNIWKFFTGGSDSSLIYTFEIRGTPTGDFQLDVSDFVTTNDALVLSEEFSDLTCIPTFADGTRCGLFDVSGGAEASWDIDGFIVTIKWFADDDPTLQRPSSATILQAEDDQGGFVFTNELADVQYTPYFVLDPSDSGLSGRGDGFSLFGAFGNNTPSTPVPEPGTLALLGVGVVGLVSRARMRRKRDS